MRTWYHGSQSERTTARAPASRCGRVMAETSAPGVSGARSARRVFDSVALLLPECQRILRRPSACPTVPVDVGTRSPRVPINSHSSLSVSEVNHMKLKPLGDRLIVRAIEEEETTASGIVLPDTAKEKPQKGKVIAVGEGKLDDNGQRQPLDVSEGDEVLYSKYGGTEIKVDGEELLVLRESDVLAKVQG